MKQKKRKRKSLPHRKAAREAVRKAAEYAAWYAADKPRRDAEAAKFQAAFLAAHPGYEDKPHTLAERFSDGMHFAAGYAKARFRQYP